MAAAQVLLLLLLVGCSLATIASAQGTMSLHEQMLREQQMREMHRPMLTSRYLEGLAGASGDFQSANGAAFGEPHR